jgi:hypothetical protein
MGLSDEEQTQRVLIKAAMVASDIPHRDAWQRYVEYSGLVDTFGVRAYLAGMVSLPLDECNLLAHAVNELIDEQPPPLRAPYRSTTKRAGTIVPAGLAGVGEHDESRDELLRQWLFSVTDETTDGITNEISDEETSRRQDP